MRCPHCDNNLADADAAFCPHCGRPLRASEGHTTERLDAPVRDEREVSDATTPIEARHDDAPPPRMDRGRIAEPAADLARATRRAFVSGGWIEASAAAGVAFLSLLVIGAILLVAAKLSSPGLLSDAGAIDVLSALVILGIASLGATVHLDGVIVWSVPLGALVAALAAVAWATASLLRRLDASRPNQRVVDGAKVGVPLGVMCWLGALVFRLGDRSEIFVGALGALVAGTAWGALAGAAGGLALDGSLRAHAHAALQRFARRSADAGAGVIAAAAALTAAAVLAVGGLLLWIVVALARGAVPAGFGAADAVAAVVYVAAFLPNLLVAIVTLSLGAPIQLGIVFELRDRVRANVGEFSLLDWGGDGSPLLLFGLLVIPLVTFAVGGAVARHVAADRNRMLQTLGWFVAVCAIAMFVLALVGRAQVGVGLVRARGTALLAPEAAIVAVLTALWAGIVGAAGWWLTDRYGDVARRARGGS